MRKNKENPQWDIKDTIHEIGADIKSMGSTMKKDAEQVLENTRKAFSSSDENKTTQLDERD